LYTNYIPALHMTTSIIIIFYNVYLSFLVNSDKLENFEMKNYFVIASQIMVLVIELRIRKNEITRGLVRYTSAIHISWYKSLIITFLVLHSFRSPC
jgi:hypothetical protein